MTHQASVEEECDKIIFIVQI